MGIMCLLIYGYTISSYLLKEIEIILSGEILFYFYINENEYRNLGWFYICD